MKLDLDTYLRLIRAIEELRDLAEKGAVIIVEGRRDVEALRRLGVEGEIIASANHSNAKIVDIIGQREVVILTDWDRRGEALKDDLVVKLSSWGVTPNLEIRKRIFSIVGRIITEVEDLADFVFEHQL